MDINENIKQLAKARGLTFAELANRLNITRQTLYRQSTGAAQLSSLEKIAGALSVPVWIILHPAPLAALMQHEHPAQMQTPAALEDEHHQDNQTNTAPAVLICPHCHKLMKVNATPIQPEDNTSDQATSPEPWTATTTNATR